MIRKLPLVSPFGFALGILLVAGCDKDLKTENAALRDDVQTVTASKNALDVALAKKTAELEGANTRLGDATARNDDLSKRLSAVENENQDLRSKLAEMNALMTSATTRADTVQKELDDVRAASQKAEAAREAEQLNRKGELNGSVSYYFNENYGYKPDVGAEVYVWKKGDYPESFRADLQNFLMAKATLEFMAVGGHPSASQVQFLSSIGIKSDKDLDAKANALCKQVLEIKDGIHSVPVAIDGAGSFHHSFPPGDYYALICSAHRTSVNALEVSGDLDLSPVTIAAGEETDVTVKFEVD